MKPGGGVNSLGKFGASAESSKLLLGRLKGVYLFNILPLALSSPMACYFHWVGANAEFLPVVSSLEHCSVIMFHPGISKTQRGKKPEKVFGTGLHAVLAQSSGILG